MCHLFRHNRKLNSYSFPLHYCVPLPYSNFPIFPPPPPTELYSPLPPPTELESTLPYARWSIDLLKVHQVTSDTEYNEFEVQVAVSALMYKLQLRNFSSYNSKGVRLVFIYTEGEGGSPVKGWTSESRVM